MKKVESTRNGYLNKRFADYVEELGLAFRKTSSITHAGDKGGSRENAIRKFLSENLPERYGVVCGEVVDLLGGVSPQMDVMIFDKTDNFPFEVSGHISLPAEALLVSVEIKSSLNVDEVRKSIAAARRLRTMKPFAKALGGRDVGNVGQANPPCRYFHSLFAFQTDLSEDGWAKREYLRYSRENNTEHSLDSIFVLDRGLINLSGNKGQAETPSGRAIANFYFSILNFLQREGGRRKVVPYESYVSGHTASWEALD